MESTFFKYKQSVLQLNIHEPFKDPNSIKCCCDKYIDFLVNNRYGQIIAGDLKILNNDKLYQLKSKGAKYGEL